MYLLEQVKLKGEVVKQLDIDELLKVLCTQIMGHH